MSIASFFIKSSTLLTQIFFLFIGLVLGLFGWSYIDTKSNVIFAQPGPPQGPPGLSNIEVVSVQSQPILVNETVAASVDCPTGKVALGGGAQIVSNLGDVLTDNSITNTYPIGNPPTSWKASMYAAGTSDTSLKVYAICTNVL